MSSTNSINKIEGFNAISSALSLFMVNLAEVSNSIKSAADEIAVPAVSNTATGILSIINSTNTLCVEVSEDMVKIVKTWGDRQGFGEQARAAFEECESTVKKVAGNTFTVPSVEPCDGLHENVTDETVAAFKKTLEELSNARLAFIQKMSEAKSEYETEDTVEVYENIGIGVEKFTNGVIAVLDEHKAELDKFGLALDESIAAVKAQSSNITAAGDTAKAKISDIDAGLD